MNSSAMKRSYSMSDSDDCSDDGRGCVVTSGNYRSPSRKRRRGVIEKRRRDRINNSLDELKRLVPQALEKSTSAKLEKAEILQMTVDHLRILQNNKAYDGNNSYKVAPQEAHKIATDYHGLGFRECASEVARFLIAIEGLDDIRVRLMSHLQMFLSQKEFSNRAIAPTHQSYNSSHVSQSNQYTPQGTWTPYSGYYSDVGLPKSADPYNMTPDPLSYFAPLAPAAPLAPQSTSPTSTTSASSTSVNSSTSLSSSPSITTLTSSTSDQWAMMNNGFAPNHHQTVPSSHHFSAFTAAANPANSAYGKPYRPWGGAEMAC